VKQPHLIRTQVFEVSFTSKDKSHELQDKISRLFNNSLFEKMEALFDRMIPENRTLRIDSLQIDIGTIPFHWLDEDVAGRIIDKLEQEFLSLLLRDNTAVAGDEGKPADNHRASSLTLLEYFLLRGTLPWWAGSGSPLTDPAKALELLCSRSPQELRALILRIGQQAAVRLRLVSQFPEPLIRETINVIEPHEAGFIFDYHTEVLRIQYEKQLVKEEHTAFSRAIWLFIITYLIVDRGSHFNRKDFVRSNLRNMAAHYNTSFHELLLLFAGAIRSFDTLLNNTDSLRTIILELSVEEQHAAIPLIPAGRGSKTETSASSSEDQFRLLHYYFMFGSFPYWLAGTLTKAELNLLFAELIQSAPQTVESMIRSTAAHPFSRQVLVKTLNAELLSELVELIEPDNAAFIIDYVTGAKSAHAKKPLIKTTGDELQEAMWLFIFEYLLADRGSEFNRRMFLESTIRRLANRFNIRYGELLTFMVKGATAAHHASPRHFSLFQELMGLYRNIDEKPAFTVSSDSRAVSEERLSPARSNVSLKNLLYFWLQWGYLPWWAGNNANRSASALFEQLIQESPEEARTLLKFAGLNLHTRRRMAYQVDALTLLRLLHMLPAGSQATPYYEYMAALFDAGSGIRFRDTTTAASILLLTLWETMIESAYNSFPAETFIRSFLFNLSAWSGITVKKLAASLQNIPPDILPGAVTKTADREHLFQSLAGFSNLQQLQTWAGGLRQLPDWVRELRELPGGIHTGRQFAEWIRTLAQLPAWAKKPPEPPDTVVHPGWSDEAAVEQRLVRSLSTARNALNQEALLEEAFAGLRYFLREGRLPDVYRIAGEAVHMFLKQLLLYLLQRAEHELERLLQSTVYPAENFLKLHALFSTAANREEHHINALLGNSLEKDILLYIEQAGELQVNQRSFLQLIDRYLRRPLSRQTAAFLKMVTHYTAVSGRLAHYFRNDESLRLLENPLLFNAWGSGAVPFIRTFQNWLSGLIADSLDRERLLLLFRTFGFMMIGGEVTPAGEAEYIRYFFRFVFERNYPLLLQLSVWVEKALKKRKTMDALPIGTSEKIAAGIARYIVHRKLDEDVARLLAEADRQAIEQPGSGFRKKFEKDQKQLKKELEERKALQAAEEEPPEPDTGEMIQVKNAGLVLLHPFLPVYFSRLGMTEKGGFISPEARRRAAHLMQYLVYGTQQHDEHELVLNKILCNIPVGAPIVKEIVITAEEERISGELLQAVLTQWEKLKNTTTEGLQTAFLQRKGSLVKPGENWVLRVEQRGYDVLLQTLPWGIGMIKTSWMTEFLIVEWT
jgi:hypothetical protein